MEPYPMTRQVITPYPGMPKEDWEALWHRMRARVITSTDSATLFHYNRYQSLSMLWNLKRAHQVQKRTITAEMARGKDREWPVAELLAKRHNLNVAPMPEFIQVLESRLGSSYDAKILHGSDSIPFEIKTASIFVVLKGYWQTRGQELLNCGPRIEFQLQHEMHVGGFREIRIGAETTDGRLWFGRREYSPLVGQMIEDKAGEFWKAFDRDIPLPGIRLRKVA